jgi:hypothetical protein
MHANPAWKSRIVKQNRTPTPIKMFPRSFMPPGVRQDEMNYAAINGFAEIQIFVERDKPPAAPGERESDLRGFARPGDASIRTPSVITGQWIAE